jgi:hypothetical protein
MTQQEYIKDSAIKTLKRIVTSDPHKDRLVTKYYVRPVHSSLDVYRCPQGGTIDLPIQFTEILLAYRYISKQSVISVNGSGDYFQVETEGLLAIGIES